MSNAKKIKSECRNPFQGAEDIYATKNKIVVTKLKKERRNNVEITTIKTKYYNKNDSNLRILRKVQPEVRSGRNGDKYEKI